MRKFIKSTFRLILLLAILASTTLYWRSLRAVESFLHVYPTNVKIEYKWMIPWFDGTVRLFDVGIYDAKNEAIVRAKQLIIDLRSVRTLITAKELLELRDYPERATFFLKDAITTDEFRIAETFNYLPNLKLSEALLPASCQGLSLDPRPFRFDANLQFFYDVTGSGIDWQAEIDSAEFSHLKMHLKQANFLPLTGEASYIDEWHLEINDPLWLNQLNQQCQKRLNLVSNIPLPKQQELAYKRQLTNFATSNNWNLSPQFADSFARWLALPGKMTIEFAPPRGISFSQLAESQVDNFVALTGLTVTFDEKTFKEFFASKDYMNEMKQKAISSQDKANDELSKPVTPEYIQPRASVVTNYSDSKVEVTLQNGRNFIGYIRKVEASGFQLEVREAKGSSILPFAWQQVKSLRLIRVQ